MEIWAHSILRELSDDVAECVECPACESERAVWVGVEEMLVCSGEGDGSRHVRRIRRAYIHWQVRTPTDFYDVSLYEINSRDQHASLIYPPRQTPPLTITPHHAFLLHPCPCIRTRCSCACLPRRRDICTERYRLRGFRRWWSGSRGLRLYSIEQLHRSNDRLHHIQSLGPVIS